MRRWRDSGNNRGNNGGQNVVCMSEFGNTKRFKALSQVEAYWTALKRPGAIPNRSDVDPRGIEDALEFAFILERVAPGMARIRIAGMHLNELMGMEVRGMPISSFLTPASRTGFESVIEEVLNGPATARLMLNAAKGIGRPRLEGQMLLLPMQNDLGDVNRLLGCLETHGPIGRGPRRFDLMGHQTHPLDTGPTNLRPSAARTAWCETDADADAQSELTGFAEESVAFRGAPAKSGRPDYLRLIKSD